MVSFMVTFLRQVGHLPLAPIADLMHALQNIWPHFVDVSSTIGLMHMGHLNVGSFGGGGGGGGGAGAGITLCTFSLCQSYKKTKS